MKLILPIIIVLIVLAGGYFVANQSLIQKKTLPTQSPSPSPPSQELRTFQSKNLKFSIQTPTDFETEEKFTRVTLSSTNNDEILVNRIATDFSNLEDHLNDLNKKNKVEVIEQKPIAINKYQALVRLIKYPGGPSQGERIYNILVDNWVYSISTSSKSLYDELDQIAQSFRYIP